jgi:hypothetical protein
MAPFLEKRLDSFSNWNYDGGICRRLNGRLVAGHLVACHLVAWLI